MTQKKDKEVVAMEKISAALEDLDRPARARVVDWAKRRFEGMEHLEQMATEHQAWIDLVRELRARGVGEIERDEKDYTLYTAIVRWGEELAELRRMDPNQTHSVRALRERRDERTASINKEA